MVEGETRDLAHGRRQFRAVGEGHGILGRIEHLGRRQLCLVAGQIGAGGLGHVRAGGFALSGIGAHDRHDLVPGTGQGLAEGRVVLEGVAVDHHQVDDLAGDPAGVEHLGHLRGGGDLGQQWVPGGDGLYIGGAEGGHQVGVRGVDHAEVLFGKADLFQAAGQQVVGHGEFDQVDRLTLEVAEGLVLTLDDDAVVTVGKVADQQRGGIDAAGRRYGQGVHVGHGAAVELAGAVLVDRLDVVVDLHHIDVDVVLLRPLVDDAFGGAIFPGHPAGIDGPADTEVVFGGGMAVEADGGSEAGGEYCDQAGRTHKEPPVRVGTAGVRGGLPMNGARSPGLLSRRVTSKEVANSRTSHPSIL